MFKCTGTCDMSIHKNFDNVFHKNSFKLLSDTKLKLVAFTARIFSSVYTVACTIYMHVHASFGNVCHINRFELLSQTKLNLIVYTTHIRVSFNHPEKCQMFYSHASIATSKFLLYMYTVLARVSQPEWVSRQV